VTVETVRYYERRGLLDQPPRTPSGYRRYTPLDLWRLQLIGRAKRLGFTLAEIAELAGPSSDGQRSRAAILTAARAKIMAVDERRSELEQLRHRLEQLLEVCASGDPVDCVDLNLAT